MQITLSSFVNIVLFLTFLFLVDFVKMSKSNRSNYFLFLSSNKICLPHENPNSEVLGHEYLIFFFSKDRCLYKYSYYYSSTSWMRAIVKIEVLVQLPTTCTVPVLYLVQYLVPVLVLVPVHSSK